MSLRNMKVPVKTAAGMVDLETFRTALVRYARSMGADTARAEDLAQETIIRMVQYQDRFAEAQKIFAYMRTTLRNLFASDGRSQASRACLSLSVVDQGDMYIPDPRTPDVLDEMYKDQRARALRIAITTLPDFQRTVIEFFYVQGLSYQEIVEQTGLSEGTVKSRIFRGREALRRRLAAFL